MKKYFLLLLLISLGAYAQKDSPYHLKDIDTMLLKLDKTQRLLDSMEAERNKMFQKQELERTREQMDRNMEGLVRFQKEREAKQRKAMWLRIGLGIAFLGVFIFGIMRKRKNNRQ